MKSRAFSLSALCLALLLCLVSSAQAFFDPNVGSWAKRDPIGEDGGANVFCFVNNTPVNQIDRMGLDVWVVRSKNWPGHEWVIGQNADGTYWDSDFGPASGGWAICGKGKVNFGGKSGFDPNNLGDDLYLVSHIVTSPAIDKKVRDLAEKQSKDEKQPNYDLCSSNCRTFTSEIAVFTRYLKTKELIEKQKQQQLTKNLAAGIY